MSSIFTKIIRGELPSFKISEDEKHFAFLDINPTAEGHTLCIPKKEIDYIFDLSEAELSDLMHFSHKIAKALDDVLEPIRTGIIVEGMEVPHAHVHLIPIYTETQNFSLGKKVNVSESRMIEISEAVSQNIKL